MEYHREPKIKPRVPITLRSLVYSVVNTKGLDEIGKGYYEWSAGFLARSFLKFHDVLEVYLIGGGLERCIPAVSDLDFLVVIDPQFENEFLIQFQKRLKHLSLRFPLLGEVHLVKKEAFGDFTRSSNASLNWFQKCHKFVGESWKRERIGESFEPLREGRLALSLFHYWKGHRFLVQSLGGHKGYFESHFQREISKCIDFLSGNPLQIRRNLPPEVLLEIALRELENFSSDLNAHPVPANSLQLDLKDRGGERFAIEIKQRQAHSKLKNLHDLRRRFQKTTIPNVFQFQIESGENNAPILRSYYQCVARGKEAPLLLGRATIQMVKYGLGWGLPYAHFDWISPFEMADPEFIAKLKHFTTSTLVERLTLNATLFRGKIVSLTPEKIHSLFFEIFYCYFALSNAVLTNDFERVEDELKKRFPSLPSKQKKDYLLALQAIEQQKESFL